MASIFSLSAELKLSIIEQLKLSAVEQIDLDLKSNSLIATPPRDIFSLSQNITLLNDEESGCFVSTILDSAVARHVRSLHYIGFKAMPDGQDFGREEALEEPSTEDFPASVDRVLSNLSGFPNLKRVTIQFACETTREEDDQEYGNSYYLFEEPEDSEDVLEAERTLLGGLESFKIKLRGGDNGAGWKINKLEGYLDFVSQLDTYFFKYLSNVKDFSFAATYDGPPGIGGGSNNTVLPLLGPHMPQLRSLSLGYTLAIP
ncbi:hypothetical protein E8E12_011009 [Didymella heteroderae]|uniref:Uncharacterized protein n=1 Tax=Didymella heteroderae TaxID=1769908 RepID=A0A9P4WX63_9PLEO|nr:hypothetical protein E8E12_011009 [Didymella heteroderae]